MFKEFWPSSDWRAGNYRNIRLSLILQSEIFFNKFLFFSSLPAQIFCWFKPKPPKIIKLQFAKGKHHFCTTTWGRCNWCWSHLNIIVICCASWYHLYNLKNVKNTHGGVLLFTPPLAFFTFLKLYKWYQIVQNITLLLQYMYYDYSM